MTRFVAIDVETANEDCGSICQIGVAIYEHRQLVDEWVTHVNPEAEFSPINVSIHGIDAEAVARAPLLPDILPDLRFRTSDAIVASYGPFDRRAIRRACERYDYAFDDARWLDLGLVVRRAWPPEMTADGWALKKMCARLGIDLRWHHDALADAKAAGEVFVRALEHSQTCAADWLELVRRPAPWSAAAVPKMKPVVADSGPLTGQSAVFTGELRMPRAEAERRVAALGCKVAANVSKKTTMVVVGQTDLAAVGPKGKSTKLIKAEQLIAMGRALRIVDEAEFLELLREGERVSSGL